MFVKRNKSFDLIYIHPSKFQDSPLFARMPLGIGGLINLVVENGYKVEGLNYPLEKFLNKNFSLENYLGEMEFKVVAIDLHWYEHAKGALDIARICKGVNRNCKVILGGLTSSLFAKEILNFSKDVDFIIRGDAEEPFLELVKLLIEEKENFSKISNLCFRKDENYVENPLNFEAKSIDKYNYANLDFLRNKEKYFYLMDNASGVLKFGSFSNSFIYVGRGCIYNCSYCGGSELTQKFFRRNKNTLVRSSENIVQDLVFLYKKEGVKKFFLNLDLQLIGKNLWQKLFYLIRKENLKVGISVELWDLSSSELPNFIYEFSKTVDKELSQVLITPITGSEELRRFNGKSFENKKIFEVLKLIRKNNLSLEIYFSPLLPGENFKTFKESLNMARAITDYYPSRFLEILFYPIPVDPFSPLSLNPGKYKQKVFVKDFKDYYKYCLKKGLGKLWSIKKLGYHSKFFFIPPIFFQILWLKENFLRLLKRKIERSN